MKELQDKFASELRAAYARGEAEYGPLPLPFDVYSARAARILLRHVPAEALGAALRGGHSADLYLAIACDTHAAGAWDLLAQRFYPGLRAAAIRAGASAAEAEEIARELPGTLIEPPASDTGATRIAAYDGRGSLFSWLVSIANRRHIDRMRARRDRTAPAPSEPTMPPEAVVGWETGDRLEAAMRKALLDLTTREVLLLVWKFRDDLSQSAMAARLEVSEPRVSQLMKRTIAKVRESVRDRIQDESAPYWAARDELWTALRNVVGRLLSDR